jgi:VIT1/CCC1 family predicted Fe2+/Mn2+ transporter
MDGDRERQLIEEHHPAAIQARLQGPARENVVSDAVLGGIDGCVTTFAVVCGAVGAGFSSSVALVLGFANLLADGFSMAVSNYESIKAEREFAQSVRESEEEHIDTVPAGEREEIRQIFRQKGFSGDVLDRIVDTISSDRHLWIETMLTEEHGIQRTGRDPVRAALTTMISFVLVGAIPLLPFLMTGVAQPWQFLFSTCLAAAMFFSIGAMKSRVFCKPVLRAGAGTLLTGGTAAALAFLVGYLLRELGIAVV